MRWSERHHERCGCSAAGGPFALASAKRHYERPRPFSVRHLALDLALDVAAKRVSGSATLDIERVAPKTDTLSLDAVGFTLNRVQIDLGSGLTDAPYDYDGDTLGVKVPVSAARATVRIEYAATPARGLYFLAPDEAVPERPEQVWSQCQDEDARHWFPCHDKPHVKMTTELRVAVPSGFTVLSNGEPVFTDTPATGDPWVYHFRLDQPHPAYLMTLVAGRFDVVEDRPARIGDRSIPVQYLVPPGKKDEARRSFGETPRMIELFSRLTGVDFPWTRYSQVVVHDFIFGGMENTTATTMYEHILLDERAAIDVTSNDLIAHELAHQWFGDLVTCRDWSHGWLNEGFATYMEHVEREDRLGRDEYDWGVEGDLSSYLAEASGHYQRPIVCRDYEAPIDLFDRHLYEKGGLVLHMLRRELGEELFWKGVRTYLRRHPHGIVETADLQRALEDASGASLERFFDSWVYRPGHPALKVRVSYEDGQLTAHVKQTHKVGDTPLFAFPLELAVADAAGKVRRFEKRIDSAADALTVALGERPTWVAFDPDFKVTADVTFEAPADMLKHALAEAEPARARWQAARSLSKRHDLPTIEALAACLSKPSEAWMVRAEAARALGSIRGSAAEAALLAQVEDEHPKVRRAVAMALGNFRTGRVAKALSRLARKDLSYLVEAEAARSLGKTRHKSAGKTLLELLERPSWADVARAGALDGLGALRDDEHIGDVRKYTRYGVPARGRRAAIAALARLSDGRKTREHLEDLLDDQNPHLRIDVIAALESLADPRARAALNRRLRSELDGRVVRRIREALRNIGERLTSEHKRLTDELESVKGELSELKVRLGKLERGGGVRAEEPQPEPSEEVPSEPESTEPAATRPRPKRARGPRGPAKKAPATKAPATKAPAKRAPAKRAPAKKAPATKAPAKKAPAKKPRSRK